MADYSQFELAQKMRSGPTKILWIGDFHIPFHNVDALAHILDRHRDADILLIGGDAMDEYGISSFSKKDYITSLSEYVIYSELIDIVSDIFPWVVQLKGNHEARYERQVLNKVPPEVRSMIDKCFLQRIADGERFNEDRGRFEWTGTMENVVCPLDEAGNTAWSCQIGKTIFGHPEVYSKIEGKAVQNAWDWFLKRGQDFDCLVIGHTHKLVKIYKPRHILIEAGSLRHPASYANHPKLRYGEQVPGYCVIYQDEFGNVDRQKSDVFCVSHL